MPSIGPSAAASSCAIARGAFRNRRASSKATGTAKSPNARRGGVSITIVGWSPSDRLKVVVSVRRRCSRTFA